MQWRFYQLTHTGIEKALPALVSKIYTHYKKIWILFNDNQSVLKFDEILWTYTPISFLPHGRFEDDPKLNPIFLSTQLPKEDEHFEVLVLPEPMFCDPDILCASFNIGALLFNKKDQEQYDLAFAFFQKVKNQKCQFWTQDAKGWAEGPLF